MKRSMSTLRRLFSRHTKPASSSTDITSRQVQLQSAAVQATSTLTYTITAGDTLSSIAGKLGTTAQALQQANPGLNPNNLQVGQVIQLLASGTRYTIQAGDTYGSIATKLGTTVAALQAINPGVNPNALQVGQAINIPLVTGDGNGSVPTQPQPAPTTGKYNVAAGDTFTSIAAKLGISLEALEGANPGVNPNALQVGQSINIPSTTLPAPSPVAPTPTPTTGKYNIAAGDTFTSIAARLGTTVAAIQAANPGVNPNALQVGQTINIPTGTGSGTVGGGGIVGSGSRVGGPYVEYNGPASSFPDPSQWASYDILWAKNSSLMSYSDSASEIALIGNSIGVIAKESGLDGRVILCIIMQESGGNVRVGTTFNGVTNTGIMQAYNGASFNPSDPSGSILQMIRDGAEGTASGPGLKQAYAEFGNWYEVARKYNSGSVDRTQLNNPLGATAGYVKDFANRLMGHVWAGM